MLWWKYQQLRMGNAKSRLAVVEKLADSHDDDVVGPLIFALEDKEESVRCAAAKALMRFQDPRAVEPLVRMLRDSAPLARAAAAEALGHLGDPVAISHLVGFLRDGDPVVRTIAARSLGRLGWKPDTGPHRVLQILATGQLEQLVALGPEGVSPLLELLRNGPPNRQLAAVNALGQIHDPRVPPAMMESLRRPSPAVRMAALGVLEQLAEASAYPDVEKLLRDTDANVRAAAVEAAARCGGARAVPALLRCLKDAAWEVRRAAATALGSLGDRSAVEGLCEMIADPDRDVRESVLTALGQIADRRAVAPMVLALLDVESSVRSTATATLARLEPRWEQNEGLRRLAPKISRALKHPDYWVRHCAGKLLERLHIDIKEWPAAEATPDPDTAFAPQHPAVAVLADLLFDRDRDLRLAAAGAFARLCDPSAATVLAAAARDTDVFVRNAAQEALAALKAAGMENS